MGFLNTVKHFLGFESEDDYYDDDYYDEEEAEELLILCPVRLTA